MLSIVKYIVNKYMYCKVVYNACLIKIVPKKLTIKQVCKKKKNNSKPIVVVHGQG